MRKMACPCLVARLVAILAIASLLGCETGDDVDATADVNCLDGQRCLTLSIHTSPKDGGPFDINLAPGLSLEYNVRTPYLTLSPSITRVVTWPEQVPIAHELETHTSHTEDPGDNSEFVNIVVIPNSPLEERWYALIVSDVADPWQWMSKQPLRIAPYEYAIRFLPTKFPRVRQATISSRHISLFYTAPLPLTPEVQIVQNGVALDITKVSGAGTYGLGIDSVPALDAPLTVTVTTSKYYPASKFPTEVLEISPPLEAAETSYEWWPDYSGPEAD
ncbi:MAG: hypothetical protein AUK47_16920 [Deltaproteobacteria bacterium CG2_30_63_29]|nr:MAG: hypothetical protein AUK47_16920 [Deltaproteobacteria bacterium CG2_30_63_29]PIW00803.1 MAG: hypothetical protein COW42_06750 [Deltaproteobacteria bacterium CG17_big_fil_post_rev_8_21_14_2_50_63_7]